MPQKKNPDPLEYLRGKTGGIFGNLFSMLTILKGLPLSYFKDLQDDYDIVMTAIEQNKKALQYASKRLQDDPAILLASKAPIPSLVSHLHQNNRLEFITIS